jgi:serine protease Do
MISAMKPGSTVKLTVLRDGKSEDVSVTVGEAPSTPAKGASASLSDTGSKLGVTVRPLTKQESEKAGTEGVLVEQVQGAAEKAGILAGDIIVNVNGHAVKSASDLKDALSGVRKSARVLVQRGKSRIFIPVRIGEKN